MRSVWALVLIQIVTGVASSPSECSWDGFESCTGPLPILGVDLAPNFDDSRLTSICSSWDTVKPCLDTMGEHCAPSEESTEADELANNTTAAPTSEHDDVEVEKKTTSQASQELEKGYGFICESDNMNDYKRKVRECLTENIDTLTTASTKCHGIYYDNTWWLNRTDAENVYKFCSAALKYLDCQKEAGQQTCGDEFAGWVWSYHLSLWTPHLDDIECVPGNGMDAGALAIVSICCAAAAMAIIFTIISLIMKSAGPTQKKDDSIKKRPDSATQLSNGKSSESMTELGRNGSVKDGVVKSSLASVPEHGILKQRHTDSTKL